MFFEQVLLTFSLKVLKVRTRFPLDSPNLSEVASSSDSIPLGSPNLSEVASGSDSIPLGFTKPVRSCLKFGLDSPWIHQTCPKLPQVRTRFSLDSPNLSEVDPSSDSIPLGFTKPVRSCLRFGLDSPWIHQTCPKLPQVRTRFPWVHQTCLKLPLVRTRLPLISPYLSEGPQVRTRFSFDSPSLSGVTSKRAKICTKSNKVYEKSLKKIMSFLIIHYPWNSFQFSRFCSLVKRN